MKKHLIALAVCGVTASSAMAQSSSSAGITLYGVADVALARASNINGGSVTLQDSGRNMSSRIGFRGNEDLGGGLSALFTMESGFNLDSGTNTSSTVFFNRQSFVGLSSTAAGTLTLGRQYTPLYDHLILLSGAPTFGVAGGAVDGIGLPGSSAGRFDNTIGGSRLDNSIKYTSPNLSGVKLNAMYSLGEVAGSTSAGQSLAVGAGYNQGPISSGMGYQTKKCAAATGCTGTQAEDKLFAAGASYNFGVASLSGIYSNQKNAKNVLGTDGNVYHLMINVPVGAWTLSVGAQRLDDRSKANQDIKQYNLSAVYTLSKRTRLYAFYSNQSVDNGGKASMAVSNSSDGKQSQLAFGITHLF